MMRREQHSGEPVEGDPSVAAEAFAAAHRLESIPLDFSMRSLEEDVDRALDLPIFNRGRDRAATESEERAEAALCAYVGETLRRRRDGEWVGQFFPTATLLNFYRSFVRFGAFRFSPHAFVGYRLTNGPEEGSFRDYLLAILPFVDARLSADDPHFD